MEIWIVIKDAYEDQKVVGVATSEESAQGLLEQVVNDPTDAYQGIIKGPYPLDKLHCACFDEPGLCFVCRVSY